MSARKVPTGVEVFLSLASHGGGVRLSAGSAAIISRELRALLACARALEAVPHLDSCPAFGFDAPEEPCDCHRRALSRLRSLSRPAPAKKGARRAARPSRKEGGGA